MTPPPPETTLTEKGCRTVAQQVTAGMHFASARLERCILLGLHNEFVIMYELGCYMKDHQPLKTTSIYTQYVDVDPCMHVGPEWHPRTYLHKFVDLIALRYGIHPWIQVQGDQ